MCLVSVKLFIVRTILCATVQTYATYTTIITTITTRSLFLFVHKLFVSTKHTYSLALYSKELQTTTVLFTRNITQGGLDFY